MLPMTALPVSRIFLPNQFFAARPTRKDAGQKNREAQKRRPFQTERLRYGPVRPLEQPPCDEDRQNNRDQDEDAGKKNVAQLFEKSFHNGLRLLISLSR